LKIDEISKLPGCTEREGAEGGVTESKYSATDRLYCGDSAITTAARSALTDAINVVIHSGEFSAEAQDDL